MSKKVIAPPQLLLIEDDPDIRERLRRSIADSSGINVCAVPSVVDCLQKLDDPTYDPAAVIVDLHITHGKGGHGALKEFRASKFSGQNLAMKNSQGSPEPSNFLHYGPC